MSETADSTPSSQGLSELLNADLVNRGSRRHRRFSITANASITDDHGITESATVLNLSASGLMLHVPVRPKLTVGSTVHLVFLRTAGTGVVRHVSSATAVQDILTAPVWGQKTLDIGRASSANRRSGWGEHPLAVSGVLSRMFKRCRCFWPSCGRGFSARLRLLSRK